MAKTRIPEPKNDIFASIFYFVSNNGFTKVMFPEAWNKEEERATIIEMEKKHLKLTKSRGER
jgi:hypothetical protein